MSFFEQNDIQHLAISDDAGAGSIEVSPNITAELNEEGALVGIEILRASRSFAIRFWKRCKENGWSRAAGKRI